jgi:hypothetical protein
MHIDKNYIKKVNVNYKNKCEVWYTYLTLRS